MEKPAEAFLNQIQFYRFFGSNDVEILQYIIWGLESLKDWNGLDPWTSLGKCKLPPRSSPSGPSVAFKHAFERIRNAK